MILKRLFKDREAMTFSVLLTVIIIVVSGFVLFGVASKIIISVLASDNTERCHLSILAADQASAIKDKTMSDFIPDIDCDSKDVPVVLGDVVRTRGGRIDDDMVKKVVADELSRCWSMVGAGKLVPIDTSLGSDRTHCLVCSIIRFDEDVEEAAVEQGYSIDAFEYYLATRNPSKSSMSYLQYLTGKMPSAEEIANYRDNGVGLPLDADDPLYVIWRIDVRDDRAATALVAGALLAPLGVPGDPISALMGGGLILGMNAFTDATVIQSVHVLNSEGVTRKILLGDEERDMCTIMLN